MYNNSRLASSIRKALTFGALSALTVPLSFQASAQSTPSNEGVEKISITGSRIVREEFASSSAISVFDAEDLKNSGVTSIDEFLKFTPAVSGFQLGATTNNGNDGQRKVDLRGLGFNRTLVLINGRRQIGDLNDDGAVDLNSVPFNLVERIEVLKDGASTIYGTDAIAGVINIILKDDFEGVDLQFDHGRSAEGDAQNTSVSVVMGAASEKGNIVIGLEYNKQKEMVQADRDWAFDGLYSELQGDGSYLAVPSGSSNSRRIRGVPGLAGNYIVDETTGQVRPFDPSRDTYNFSPVNALVTPNERWQMALNGKYEIADDTQAYMEASYTRRTSAQRLAPDASFGVTADYIGIVSGQAQRNDLVPASNPFNPFGVNASGADGVLGTADDLNPYGIENQTVRVNRRFVESGGRRFLQTADTFRFVTGLNGELGSDIYYDFAYTFAQNEVVNETKFYHRFDRWETAVTPELCNADPACAAAGVIDPFGPYGSISDEQMAFISANSLKDLGLAQMQLWQFNLTGDFGELDGGTIGWSFGIEHRKEKGDFIPDEFTSEGLTTGGAADPQSGSFSVDEVYGEVYLPVTSDLAVEMSARYSEYDTSAGETFNYKIGVDYSIIDQVRVRAGYATGFRAPNISELNQQDETDFPVVESYCEFADRRTDITDTIRQNCLALLGEDNLGADGEFGFAWQSAYTTSAQEGDELEAEESVTKTFGLIFDNFDIEGLRGSIDYWDIKVDGWIESDDINSLLYACLNSPNLTATACNAFPNGLYDGIFPGDATGAFGNLGTLSAKGIDFEAEYKMDVNFANANTMQFRLSGSYLLERIEDFPIVGASETAGTAEGAAVFPELKVNGMIGLNSDDWSLNWDIIYIGEADDRWRPAEITSDAKAESIVYHDLVATYTFSNVTLTAGINNVTDEDPPYFHSAFNANTEPGAYDVIGRRYFVQTKFSF
ncbi:TonB-dependent receptor [Aestuariibacter sp. AA17]|uniref:TonB-dependent receptor n=1 Tax=Fluctibacter corallii TaxID=2984329 RepID=A0ABT3A418_9ALTE|nr:TonB-dependent receptor [Aestuariibacter sp. AA17]MCV2883141.1 TonB-dependent receptor [Aestuariibacter sp. AA17]